jgi:leucyl aminopeptidase
MATTPKFQVKSTDLTKITTDCAVVLFFEKRVLSDAAKTIDQASNGALRDLLQMEKASGKAEEIFLLRSPMGIKAKRVLLVGAGDPKKLDDRAVKRLVLSIGKQLSKINGLQAHLNLDPLCSDTRSISWLTQHCAQWLIAHAYTFTLYKSKPTKKTSNAKADSAKEINRITLDTVHNTRGLTHAAKLGTCIAQGMRLTRDLGNTPGNVCHPTYLASQARKLANQSKNMSCKIIDEKELKAMGAGAFCAVSQGSKHPGKLILLHYTGAKQRTAQPYTFVGKGITFDTGGISIKPGAGMEEMKYDMCGAATVLGLMHIVDALSLPINVTGVIAAAENMPSGEATRPGDIVTTLSGKTVEILNTDAEGRLVLCDALTYIGRFKPKIVVDIATLTGACIVALGHHYTGMVANDQPLAEALLAAGEHTTDFAWQLPLTEEYTKQLDNKFADLSNIGGRSAGTITAGAFLAEFTKDYRWAHLDIAGTAWNSGGQDHGATGRPVPLLANYLINVANGKS